MRELQLDSIHDDGEHIVLTDTDGEQYTLRIDEALRAAVRRDKPALGLIQSAERTPLRPREIQALLRAGHDAEEIVRISDIDIEHVRRYEGPVLAEREFTAQRAQRFPVGRSGGPTLAEIAAERLRARQASPERRWDAWRREDGTWTIALSFEAAGKARVAHWQADMARQSVVADDDEARWMTDEDYPDADAPRPRARLTAVRGRVYDVEADGGVDHPDREGSPAANAGRTGPWRTVRPSVRADHPSSIGEDELDALNARRGLRPVPSPSSPEDRDGDDHPEHSVWTSVGDDEAHLDARDHDEAPADSVAATEHASGTDASPAREDDGHLDTDLGTDSAAPADEGHDHPGTPVAAARGGSAATGRGGSASGDEPHEDTVELTPLPGFDDAEAHTGSARKRSRSRRATMPSWDEIVFGSKND